MTSASSAEPPAFAVGVTQRVQIDPRHGERRDALDQRWHPFLAACGIVGVPLPNDPALALKSVRALGLRGILLTGGNDLAVLGGDAPERDATEAALLELAVRGLPVLGVCRGLQMILAHFDAVPTPVAGHVAVRHPLVFQGQSRTVNSYHGYGAAAAMVAMATAGALEVTAAVDGTVEAVRHRSLPIAGLMWHPEREAPFDPLDIEFFKNFFGATP
ncbi:gamma-glutamyl-gamma-aminobutyrate hydrolase (plasmid) [Azospirillum sp. TSA2s]|uniref:gamma-glutamyl-gamma-aminobutyrate hydrolase family protein n=1 Tax=Azospirillum sp. TSA2s TaxID=709810 RepID=UPI0010A9D0E3|nr:gamma-glutamyl-gamma-aminobutyrate hydrolase family protein [Azospirillum sp. TSA2s]QCG93172.1 gamma-glutamyl-gamma-aminobutyrate hydrolase [Azospirillum sp. TSA2s]